MNDLDRWLLRHKRAINDLVTADEFNALFNDPDVGLYADIRIDLAMKYGFSPIALYVFCRSPNLKLSLDDISEICANVGLEFPRRVSDAV